MKQQARVDKKQLSLLPGIPIKDTANNEMTYWLGTLTQVFLGQDSPDFLFKGDNVSKFPQFKNILAAMTDNNLFKFSMVTNPESAPRGTDLWKRQMAGDKSDVQ